jgi:Predicted solute binding protein
MANTTLSTAASLLMLATTVFAACESISYTTCADTIVHWYDPTNGQVCDPIDCGGGRAPVKYDEPCCAAYRGTKPCVSTTSTLSCWSPSTVAASSTIASASSAETTSASTTVTVTATSDTSVLSSTGGAAETSSHSISGSTIAPSTTEAPTQSTNSETSASGANNSSSPSQPVSTNIAGTHAGPVIAVAVAVVGAVILI